MVKSVKTLYVVMLYVHQAGYDINNNDKAYQTYFS